MEVLLYGIDGHDSTSDHSDEKVQLLTSSSYIFLLNPNLARRIEPHGAPVQGEADEKDPNKRRRTHRERNHEFSVLSRAWYS